MSSNQSTYDVRMSDDREQAREDVDDEIASNRWFTLTLEDSGYIVREAGAEALEARFPETGGGFEEAWKEFSRLSRRASRRAAPVTAFVGVATVGVVIWILSGAYQAISLALREAGEDYLDFSSLFSDGADPWMYAAEAIGYRLGVGSLIALAAWLVGDRLRADS